MIARTSSAAASVHGGEQGQRAEHDRHGQQRLHPEHRPVAHPPHPHADQGEDERAEQGARGLARPRRGRSSRSAPRGSPRASTRGNRHRERDRARPLPRRERHERRAGLLVALARARVAALQRLRHVRRGAASARVPPGGPCGACASCGSQPSTGTGSSRPRRAAATAAGSGASRSTRTTASRRAPASATASTLSRSMPPIANHGLLAGRGGRVAHVAEPGGRAPLLRGRLVHGAHADLVHPGAERALELLRRVRGEAHQHVGRPPARAPPPPARRPGPRARRRPRRAAARSGRSFSQKSASCSSQRRRNRAAASSSSSSDACLSRSWTMSTPPSSAAASTEPMSGRRSVMK